MVSFPANWKKKTERAKKTLLAAGGIAGAILAIIGLGKLFFSGDPEEYDKDWIPIVYSDAGDFQSFLKRNDGKTVRINSSIALDLAVPVNHLVHQVCEMDLLDHAESEKDKTYYSIGLPTFAKDFDESELDSATYSEESDGLGFPAHVLSKVNCMNTLRIELIDPKSLRWSYGGTGTQSLPLSGTFKVTSRAFSGPSIEYTLRQIAE